MSKWITHPISQLNRRFHQSRAGSVLILVVALLVLLALLGAAYLSGTKQERYSSNQNAVNTQADLLLDGLVQTTVGTITQGLSGSNSAGTQVRAPAQEMPLPASSAQGKYLGYDSEVDNLFQASRTPTALPAGGANSRYWPQISAPLFPNSSTGGGFNSPSGDSLPEAAGGGKKLFNAFPAFKIVDGQQVPGFLYYSAAGGTFVLANGSTVVVPPGNFVKPNGAFVAAVPAYNAAAPQPYFDCVHMAADADNDGIADSGMWKLPVGRLNGIEYYAGVRVIDNNSAVNAMTAWETDDAPADDTGSPTPFSVSGVAQPYNFGFFRSNVGLKELLDNSAGTAAGELSSINTFRFGQQATAGTSPYDDNNLNHTDYDFTSQREALDTQLSSRMANPGRNRNAPNDYYLTVGLSGNTALAYRFCLANTSVGQNELEKDFAKELLTGVPTSAYTPDNFNSWYNTFFNFLPAPAAAGGPQPAPMKLRPILVGTNAVSNHIASRLGNLENIPDWAGATQYKFGDCVKGSDRNIYTALQDSAATTDPITSAGIPGIYDNAFWAKMPWKSAPEKASINTAQFEELYLAFAQMMTDSVVTPPGAGQFPQWQPPMSYPAPVAGSGIEPQLPMFRCSVRDNTQAIGPGFVPLLTPMQMVQLRAALAAVNTVDMRDPDDDVTSRHIVLNNATGGPQYDVEVYGTEAQPFIAEVMIDVDPVPANNKIVIKLVNPYPKIITINPAWRFAYISRTSLTPRKLTLVEIANTGGKGIVGTITIPAAAHGQAGYVVISCKTPPADVTTVAAGANIDGLEAAIDNELVILKPRRFDNLPSARLSVSDPFNETAANPDGFTDLVPVDQFDSTGVIATRTAVNPGGAIRIHYRRGTSEVPVAANETSYAWNFVFPGRYNPVAAGTSETDQRLLTLTQGTAAAPIDAGNMNGGTVGTSGKPVATVATTPTFDTSPIVLNNTNMAGPNQSTALAAPKNEFPYGGFARNGDMLQIPFIGAYRIRSVLAATAAEVIEINSVSMDAAMAWDTTLAVTKPDVNKATVTVLAPQGNTTDHFAVPASYQFFEQIGRFCPVGDPGVVAGGTVGTPTQDFLETGADPLPYNGWHYHWTKKLFDYVTVQNTTNRYMPNVDPTPSDTGINPPALAKYRGAIAPVAVTGVKDTDGVEGLININTAPWRVLAALPWVTKGNDVLSYNVNTDTASLGANSYEDNSDIAIAIVRYREQHGPFKTIFDLYKVPIFSIVNEQLWKTSAPMPAQGLFSPYRPFTPTDGPDSLRFDFSERFLSMNRMSNLITTRSDTYTCYVLLQGWRNGANGPTLVVQRRAAVVVDRNNVTPSNVTPSTFRFPNN